MFSNDEFHGTGKYKSNNGDIYDGQWKKLRGMERANLK